MKLDAKTLGIAGALLGGGYWFMKKKGLTGSYASGDQVYIHEGGGLKRVTITEWSDGESFRGMPWAAMPDGTSKPLPITQGYPKKSIARKA